MGMLYAVFLSLKLTAISIELVVVPMRKGARNAGGVVLEVGLPDLLVVVVKLGVIRVGDSGLGVFSLGRPLAAYVLNPGQLPEVGSAL